MTDATQQPDPFSELRGLMAGATPLPWIQSGKIPRIRRDGGDSFGSVEIANFGDWDDVEIRPYNGERWLADTRLTIAAVNSLGALLDERDRLERLIQARDQQLTEEIALTQRFVARLEEATARALSAEGEVAKQNQAVTNAISALEDEGHFIAAAILRDELDKARQDLSQEIG